MEKSFQKDKSRSDSIKLKGSDSTNKDLFFNQFTLKIIDNGQGISQEGIENLFVNFGSLKEH